jgi:hypothetical protein
MQTPQKGWSAFWLAGIAIAVLVGLQLYSSPAPPPPPAVVAPAAPLPKVVPDDGTAPVSAAELQGYQPNPRGTEEFLRTLRRPTIREAGPALFGAPDEARTNEPVLLYRALYEAYAATNNGGQWKTSRQGIGDCVSHGWAHGADIHLAVMWKLGDSGEWRAAATESIYGGSRVEARGTTFGGWSDGSYGGAAAKWVKNWGINFRQPYPDFNVDLSQYSSSRAKDWGAYGNGGKNDGGKFDAEAKKHPIRNVALVTNFDEAAAAIRSGYPVPVCSGQGFTSTRDKDGFCRASGRWSHCMTFISVRFDRPGLLCLNSWGNYVSGPKWPSDQPDGSFWVDAATATRMLSGRDSFAVSGYEGFPFRDLQNGDWVIHEPREVKQYEIAVRQRHGLPASEPHYALAP